MSPKLDPVIVIGGGIAGCYTALSLAKMGIQVILVESRKHLLAGSSNATAARGSFGFHYLDHATAHMLLHETMEFVLQYPEFLVGGCDRTSALRHCWYFVHRDSQRSVEEIDALYSSLREEYTRMCAVDPRIEPLFGPPEEFCQKFSPEEVRAQGVAINTDYLVCAYRTAESFVDWPRFQPFVRELLMQNALIELRMETRVTAVNRDEVTGVSHLTLQGPEGECVEMQTPCVVNAAWESIDVLNHAANLPSPARRVNRMKAMVEIRLSETSRLESAFWCFGPLGAITVLSDRRAFLIYEPIANIGESYDLQLPDHLQHLLYHATDEDRRRYGLAMLAHAREWWPELAEAEYVQTQFGIIRNELAPHQDANIYNKNSGIHTRAERGVICDAPGWVRNGAMKLMYGAGNGKEAAIYTFWAIALRMCLGDMLTQDAYVMQPALLKQHIEQLKQYDFSDAVEQLIFQVDFLEKLCRMRCLLVAQHVVPDQLEREQVALSVLRKTVMLTQLMSGLFPPLRKRSVDISADEMIEGSSVADESQDTYFQSIAIEDYLDEQPLVVADDLDSVLGEMENEPQQTSLSPQKLASQSCTDLLALPGSQVPTVVCNRAHSVTLEYRPSSRKERRVSDTSHVLQPPVVYVEQQFRQGLWEFLMQFSKQYDSLSPEQCQSLMLDTVAQFRLHAPERGLASRTMANAPAVRSGHGSPALNMFAATPPATVVGARRLQTSLNMPSTAGLFAAHPRSHSTAELEVHRVFGESFRTSTPPVRVNG